MECYNFGAGSGSENQLMKFGNGLSKDIMKLYQNYVAATRESPFPSKERGYFYAW
jgi:hypothetical protein